jgi:hypothetical protein
MFGGHLHKQQGRQHDVCLPLLLYLQVMPYDDEQGGCITPVDVFEQSRDDLAACLPFGCLAACRPAGLLAGACGCQCPMAQRQLNRASFLVAQHGGIKNTDSIACLPNRLYLAGDAV